MVRGKQFSKLFAAFFCSPFARHGFENGKGEAMPKDCRISGLSRRPPVAGVPRCRAPPFPDLI
jgi:hypothetical protein